MLTRICTQAQPEASYPEQCMPIPDFYAPVRQYSEGPQGDPFAPQPPPTYFPVEAEQPIVPQKPARRKKRPRKEEVCGFCDGDDTKNKEGQPELMITCDECGRSGNARSIYQFEHCADTLLPGHPSCMKLTEMGDILRSYPWKCIECKNCEICGKKGDDVSLTLV
jgi:hypothetical protein